MHKKIPVKKSISNRKNLQSFLNGCFLIFSIADSTAEFSIDLNCLLNIKTILVGSHLLHDQAWKFFTGLYISTRCNVCHASNILRHLCFHLEEQGEGLGTRRQDMMPPWLFSGCYWKHCVQHMVCSIVFFPKLPSTFSFTMTKRCSEKEDIVKIFESPVRITLDCCINRLIFFFNTIVLSF